MLFTSLSLLTLTTSGVICYNKSTYCNFKFLNSKINTHIRLFHSNSLFNNNVINPLFLTGFADGEGCFNISICKRKDVKTNWSVKPVFVISLHEKDKPLLGDIQKYLGVGKIYKQGLKLVQYKVQSINELNLILDHFDKYPLIIQKCADYKIFKQIIILIKNKDHLTFSGLQKIVALKASINRGLSSSLKGVFPDIISKEDSFVIDKEIKDHNWIAGFASAEGCFYVSIYEAADRKLNERVIIGFRLVQHIRDEKLMTSLISYLGCGKVYKEKPLLTM